MRNLLACVLCIFLWIAMMVDNCSGAPLNSLKRVKDINSLSDSNRAQFYKQRRAEYLNNLVPYANYPGDLAR